MYYRLSYFEKKIDVSTIPSPTALAAGSAVGRNVISLRQWQRWRHGVGCNRAGGYFRRRRSPGPNLAPRTHAHILPVWNLRGPVRRVIKRYTRTYDAAVGGEVLQVRRKELAKVISMVEFWEKIWKCLVENLRDLMIIFFICL